jgi:hypothetical protein
MYFNLTQRLYPQYGKCLCIPLFHVCLDLCLINFTARNVAEEHIIYKPHFYSYYLIRLSLKYYRLVQFYNCKESWFSSKDCVKLVFKLLAEILPARCGHIVEVTLCVRLLEDFAVYILYLRVPGHTRRAWNLEVMVDRGCTSHDVARRQAWTG